MEKLCSKNTQIIFFWFILIIFNELLLKYSPKIVKINEDNLVRRFFEESFCDMSTFYQFHLELRHFFTLNIRQPFWWCPKKIPERDKARTDLTHKISNKTLLISLLVFSWVLTLYLKHFFNTTICNYVKIFVFCFN